MRYYRADAWGKVFLRQTEGRVYSHGVVALNYHPGIYSCSRTEKLAQRTVKSILFGGGSNIKIVPLVEIDKRTYTRLKTAGPLGRILIDAEMRPATTVVEKTTDG